MTKFRGCIDIHSGQVKQIVGGTLQRDDTSEDQNLSTNFISTHPSSYYASLYRENQIIGTHIIKLGSNKANDDAALEALKTWKNSLQIGGGINYENAKFWIENGASHVIITSWLFPDGIFAKERLIKLSELIGKDKIVIDLSCRKKLISGNNNNNNNDDEIKWVVAINKWQTLTNFELNRENFQELSEYCDEFLVHAADVEGLCKGIDEELVSKLSEWCDIPITYAGGAKNINDLKTVEKLSKGKVDLTFGSALDIFGGDLVKFQDCVEWNKKK